MCTNNQITLYDVKLSKIKTKTVKQIPILANADNYLGTYFDPMACTLVLVDSRAQVSVYFLNLHKNNGKNQKQMKANKSFTLDISLFDVNAPTLPGEVENPYAIKSITEKLGTFFKGAVNGKFTVTESTSHRNLKETLET